MENDHNCKQENRLNRIESDLEKEAQKQEDLRQTINGKLDKIYTAIQDGDGENRKYIFTVIGIFIGAIISLVGFIMAHL